MPKAFCVLEMCAKMLSELCALCERKNLYEVCKQPNRGNLTYHAPPCGGGVGGGATVLWVRNSALMDSVKSVSSVRKNSAASLIGLISYRGCVLFLTEKHRRTEHTVFHRDIKSTDFTERYSQS